MNFVQTAEFDWLPWLNLRKKYSKIISSEAIRGMKLKLCRNVHNINLYKNMFFIAVAQVLSSLWQLKIFQRLIMGKVKVGLYFYFAVDILTKVLQKGSLSSPLQNIWILSKPLNLIGCHGNRKAKFAKSIKNSSPQKLCRIVHNISLYK